MAGPCRRPAKWDRAWGGGGTQRRPECTRDANEVYRLWHHRQQQHCVAQYRRCLLAESNIVPAGRVISGPLRRRPPQREPNLCPLAFSLNPSTLSNALVFFFWYQPCRPVLSVCSISYAQQRCRSTSSCRRFGNRHQLIINRRCLATNPPLHTSGGERGEEVLRPLPAQPPPTLIIFVTSTPPSGPCGCSVCGSPHHGLTYPPTQFFLPLLSRREKHTP